MIQDQKVESRRAIEALRAGVPNQDAVHALGSSQPTLDKRFREQLQAAQDGFTEGKQAGGMLVSGDFGSGKSHLLEGLKHIALEENFICSKIVISKETPLYNPAKVYRAAIEAASVPGRRGSALTAIAARLDFENDAYTQFSRRIHSPSSKLSSHFAATLYLYQAARDEEIRDRVIRFWSGDPINVSELRKYVKDIGEAASYKIDRVPSKELALQRYLFATQLMVAAGYSGWVLLVDEAELIGRYSLKRRATSYAELARFLGKLKKYDIPGLTCVFTMALDFETVMENRLDEDKIPSKFGGSGNPEDSLISEQAKIGMQVIRAEKKTLEKLTPEKIRETFDKLRSIYADAYGWEPPAQYIEPDTSTTARIRQHIKRWLTEWDLKRFYPDYQPDIELSQLTQDYGEEPGLESESRDMPEDIEPGIAPPQE